MRKRVLFPVVMITVWIAAFMVVSTPAHAATLKWAFQGDVQSLDPHSLNETFMMGFIANVYEGLVRRDVNLKLIPGLAEKWEVMEPTRWRFYLRKGVKFHNGNPFNADDVLFSFDRVRTEGSDMKTRVAGVEKVIKVDDYTVDIVTGSPNPILCSEWESWFIMDKEWCEEHDSTESTNIKTGTENYATRHTNGTGSFMIVDRQRDVKTVFKPNDNWWGDKDHNLTEVIFTPISSDATRVAALLSGEIDMMYPVPVQDIKRINDNPSTSALVGPELRTVFLGFNQTADELACSNVKGKNPLKDAKVRQAFYQAVNIEAIKKKIMRGLSEPSAIMISPKLFPAYADEFKRYDYDVEAAKKLLGEAGYTDGFELCMDCPNNRYVNDEAICQAVVSMLAKIGVKVNLKAQPKAQYFSKILAYDTEFYMLGWTPSSFDSHNVMYNLLGTRNDSGQGKFNLGGYANAEIDALAVKVLSETDTAKRDAMIRDAYRMLHDDVGYIPLHQQALAWGKKDSVDLLQRADNQFMLFHVTVN
jgi:peptide/nickel transport system substrate-binding protein